MCLNCGCGDPMDDRGDPANLTIDELRKAAESNRQSLRESAQHILETVLAYEQRKGVPSAGATEATRATRSTTSDADRDGLGQPAGAAPPEAAQRGTPETES